MRHDSDPYKVDSLNVIPGVASATVRPPRRWELDRNRRRLVVRAIAAAVAVVAVTRTFASANAARRWYEAAAAMQRLAQSWGDQPYGAVLVLQDQLIGEGPSRVVQNADPSAHAEREAIRDAQRRLGRSNLEGAVLYSTSRPCALCQQAAAQARVSRMVFGPSLEDAGPP